MMLMLATLISASWLVGAAPPPDSLVRQLPAWALMAYYVLLTAGAVAGWASVLWPVPMLNRRALLAELASRQAIGVAALVFALAAFATAGARAIAEGAFLLAWAGTSAWRTFHIISDLRWLERVAQEGSEAVR